MKCCVSVWSWENYQQWQIITVLCNILLCQLHAFSQSLLYWGLLSACFVWTWSQTEGHLQNSRCNTSTETDYHLHFTLYASRVSTVQTSFCIVRFRNVIWDLSPGGLRIRKKNYKFICQKYCTCPQYVNALLNNTFRSILVSSYKKIIYWTS